jgi:16S rRNA processing protein RimM
MIVTFMDSRSREEAEALRHSVLEVEVPAAEVPEDPDEFYDRQLHGLVVVDPAGVEIGTVESVLHLPSQDVLEVRLTDGPTRLVPFVKQIVTAVDVTTGVVTVDAPGGLLEGDDPDSEE